jgi:hypothetical protein
MASKAYQLAPFAISALMVQLSTVVLPAPVVLVQTAIKAQQQQQTHGCESWRSFLQ